MRHAPGPHAGRVDGFTLVEVVVVLAVVVLLCGIAVPVVHGYLQEGRRAQAEAEAKMLAGALTSFFKDTGAMPVRAGRGGNRLHVLLTGPRMPATNPFRSGHCFADWALSTETGDLLDNHLLRNEPGGRTEAAYPASGPGRWRGPYLTSPSPLDPWGRPYAINVMASWFDHATNYKRVFVLSAGPDGVLDTPYQCTRGTEPGGDDVGVVVVERN
jgi:prepilin-type N-terminal cleavage/methylation domain-containing protein